MQVGPGIFHIVQVNTLYHKISISGSVACLG